MKKLFFASVFFLGINTAVMSQDMLPEQVPSVVLNTFDRAFPDAVDVEWEWERDLYSVEFELGRRDHEVWLNESGDIVRQKEDLSSGDLPRSVIDAVNARFKDGRIDDVEKITEGKRVIFEIEVDTRDGDREFYMDEKGQLVDYRRK